MLKIAAVAMFWYALLSGSYWWILWALLVWEISGGFKTTAAFWFSNWD